jgi:hypothetical protein
MISRDMQLVAGPLSAPKALTIAGLRESPTLADALAACSELAHVPRNQIEISIGPTIIARDQWTLTAWPDDIAPVIMVRPADPATIVATATMVFKAVEAFAAANPQLFAALVNAGFALLSKAFDPRAKKQRAAQEAYSIERAGNQARPGQPVPVLMGRRRIFPSLAAPYRRRADGAGKLWLDVLLCAGVGQMDVDTPRLQDTALTSIDGAIWQAQTKAGDPAQTIYPNVCFAQYVGREFKDSADGWHTTSLPDIVTSVEVLLFYPAGLGRIKSNSGTVVGHSVTYEVRVGPVAVAPDAAPSSFSFTHSAQTRDGFHRAHTITVSPARYDVHFRRVTPNTGTDKLESAILLQVAGFSPDAPVADPDLPLISVSIPASKVSEGSIGSFNVVATSRVREVTATGPAAMIGTRNPADLLPSVAAAPFADRALPDTEIDWPTLATWRAWCVARGYSCDLYEEGEVGGAELMTRIAATGRGRWVWRNGKLSVVWDGEKPAATQLFTTRNVSRLSGKLIWPEPVHGLRVSFARAERDYATDEMEIFAQGYTGSTATLFDTAEIRDQCDTDQVSTTADRMLRETHERAETFIFETDGEVRAIKQLDRIWLTHPGGLAGLASARVLDVSAGTVKLDQAVRAPAGQPLGLRARRGANTFASIAIASFAVETYTDVLTFDGPPSLDLQVGDLVGFGVRTMESFDLVVDTIKPLANSRFQVTAWPYSSILAGTDPATVYRTFAANVIGGVISGQSSDEGIRLAAGIIGAAGAPAIGTNMVRFSRMDTTRGYKVFFNTTGLTPALAVFGDANGQNYLLGFLGASVAAGTQLFFGPDELTNLVGLIPGQRYEFSAEPIFSGAGAGATQELVLFEFDLAGAPLAGTVLGTGSVQGVFAPMGGFVTLQATTKYVWLFQRIIFQAGNGAPIFGLRRPFVGAARLDQTVLSPYSTGAEAQLGADVTGDNTAKFLKDAGTEAYRNRARQSTAPVSPLSGDYWEDTSVAPVLIKRYIGGVWVTQNVEGATRNIVTCSTVAPATPIDNDIWVDTNAPVTIKTRVGAAWVAGGNVATSLSQVNASEAAKLSGVETGATKNISTRGLLSEFPVGSPGDFYYVTDLKVLYQKIGVFWEISANNFTNTTELTDGAGLGTTAIWSGVTGSNKPQDNADVTASVLPQLIGPSFRIFDVNASGAVTPSTQLPLGLAYQLLRGATDVSTSAVWSIVGASGVTLGTITNGNVNITAIGTNGGTFKVRAVYLTFAYEIDVAVGVNTVSTGGAASAGNKGETNSGTAGAGWQTILSTTVTSGGGFASILGNLTPLTGSGNWNGRARLTIDGTAIVTTASQNVVTGGVMSAADFTEIFDVAPTVTSGQKTYAIQLERTSGTGSIDSTDTRLRVIVTPQIA